MAVTGMHYNWKWAINSSTSVQYNFARQSALAQVSLSVADGEGMVGCGITQYRTRATQNGPDVDHDYGWTTNYGYPPSVDATTMTSATAELYTGGGGQQGAMTFNVWFFG
jgi:hypothetical protein